MASSVRLPLSGHLVYFPVFPPTTPDAAYAATHCAWGKLLQHLGDTLSMGEGVFLARHPPSERPSPFQFSGAAPSNPARQPRNHWTGPLTLTGRACSRCRSIPPPVALFPESSAAFRGPHASPRGSPIAPKKHRADPLNSHEAYFSLATGSSFAHFRTAGAPSDVSIFLSRNPQSDAATRTLSGRLLDPV